MADFIVDESRFIIGEEDNSSFFEQGYKFASGIKIGEKEDETDKWQLYISEDGKNYILGVTEELYLKWIASNLLLQSDFECHVEDGRKIYVLFSSASKRVIRLTNVRVNHSLRYALELYAAFIKTRTHDLDSNLRDGIYLEDRSLILPTYSLVGKVSDRTLFENTLLEKNEHESLTAPDGLNDSVSFYYLMNALKKRGFKVNTVEPLLQSGECVDDFLLGENSRSLVTAAVILREHYQLFDTTSDSYLLFMDKLWAEALMSTTLINQISLNSVALAGQKYYVLAVKKDNACECMNDRIYGLDKHNAFELAQAIQRTRRILPEARLSDALYIQSLGVLLPEVFSKSGDTNDRALMINCLENGPFAMSPFLEETNRDLINIALNL